GLPPQPHTRQPLVNLRQVTDSDTAIRLAPSQQMTIRAELRVRTRPGTVYTTSSCPRSWKIIAQGRKAKRRGRRFRPSSETGASARPRGTSSGFDTRVSPLRVAAVGGSTSVTDTSRGEAAAILNGTLWPTW